MRTRFAPSPTGMLHIGGLRTALFAWLVAKQSGEAFTLRIEDTDKTREVQGATQDFIRSLTWTGMTIDEGVILDANGAIAERGPHGPYHQSKRLTIYHEHVQQLLKQGHAYRCFCTPERLESMRKDQERMKQPQMYDRLCHTLQPEEVQRRVQAGEKHVVRMLVPRDTVITFKDEIYGHLTFRGHTVDDQVLLKSDGFPTYHLAHVVDDHLMRMDIVIRGEEWISSLPKHLLLFQMFGWTPPKYAHMPLLLNKDRSKLSKRQNDVGATHYIERGYLPEALVNFLALLGWNPGTPQDMFSLEQLIQQFSLDRVQKSGAIFDMEKLDWLQGQWMRKVPLASFAETIRPLVAAVHPAAKEDAHFHEKAALAQERAVFYKDAPGLMDFFYQAPAAVTLELLVNEKQGVTAETLPKIIDLLKETLSGVGTWTLPEVQGSLSAAIEAAGYKKGQVLWPLRAILTGKKFSPGAFEVATALGKEESLRRLAAVQL